MELTTIRPRWQSCIVAATGPSLTPQVAEICKGHNVVAVNDSYHLFPDAKVLYACDAAWWRAHDGCPSFAGERWSSHGVDGHSNDKRDAADRYGLKIVAGRDGAGFSFDPAVIHYGSNSGFQAVNLALLMGAKRIVLVGFDMRLNGKRHYFGDHPAPLRNTSNYANFIKPFERAAKRLPAGVQILNATPGSALTCFEMVNLHDAVLPCPA